jgi:hypothetical protein
MGRQNNLVFCSLHGNQLGQASEALYQCDLGEKDIPQKCIPLWLSSLLADEEEHVVECSACQGKDKLKVKFKSCWSTQCLIAILQIRATENSHFPIMILLYS